MLRAHTQDSARGPIHSSDKGNPLQPGQSSDPMINESQRGEEEVEEEEVEEEEVAAACARLLTLLVAGHFPAGRQAAQITADRRPPHRNNGAGGIIRVQSS